MQVNNTVETDESMGMTSLPIIIDPMGSYSSDGRCAKFFLPMNDSLPKVANLFSWKDLLDIIFLLDCSIMQPLHFQHDDRNPIN